MIRDLTQVERTSARSPLFYLVLAMRPKQWVKNAFVCAGIVFAGERLFTQSWALGRTAFAFVAFCLVSGCVYLINDLVDIEKDRLHPRKRLRPLASGQLSARLAWTAAILISTVSILSPFLIGVTIIYAAPWEHSGPLLQDSSGPAWYMFGSILISYLVLQLGYTFYLKHVVILDLFSIAGGFVLRAVGGAAILGVTIMPWWLVCVLLLSLFLGLGKRRNELRVLEGNAGAHRQILNDYSPAFLDHLITIDVACTIIAYSLATFTAPSVPQEPYPLLMITIPCVIYGLFRYLYLIYQRGEGGTPEELLFQDRPLLMSIGWWAALTLAVLILW